nr:malectin-like carbohydrate-binding domain-containing protein [Tanacetum cinerariifolium]
MTATAQNINNTTLGSILLAEKLTGSNFTKWYRSLRIALSVLNSINLSGLLPDFSNMNALEIIDLHNNSLSGPIPSFLGTLPNLKQLNLADNQFSGSIPRSLSRNSKLNLSEVAYILGIKIIRDRSKWLIALSQNSYLEKILKKFRMDNSKKGYTPIMENPGDRKSQGARTPNEKSAKQSSTDMSSTEAEYIAAAEASMEAVWMRKFINGLGDVMPLNKKSMKMLCNSEPVIAITNDPGILKGARHFRRKYHYIREVIQERHTDDNVANPFTKPMPFNKHYEHAMAIVIVPASSLMQIRDVLVSIRIMDVK